MKTHCSSAQTYHSRAHEAHTQTMLTALSHCLSFSLTLQHHSVPVAESLSQSQQSSIQNISLSSLICCWQPATQNTQITPTATLPPPSPPISLSFSLFFYIRGKLQVYAAKLQSLPMSKMQRLGEIQWLFRGPKLTMTLKCRVRLWFLIVHWFCAPCVRLSEATVLLPYFTILRSLELVCISVYFQTDTAEKLTVMLQRITADSVTCPTNEIRIVII